jgi:post-segregation antitoxin (ccd killing protein)
MDRATGYLRIVNYTICMPNRTIYLPDDVDRLAHELDVNLSRLTQDAVRALARQRDDDRQARLAKVRQRAKQAGLSYPKHHLRDTRREAGDDLR